MLLSACYFADLRVTNCSFKGVKLPSTEKNTSKSEIRVLLDKIASFFWNQIATPRFGLGVASLIFTVLATATWLSVDDNVPAELAAQLHDAALQGVYTFIFALLAIVCLVLLARSGQPNKDDQED